MDAVDRISDLPPNIIEHILQCLQLKDAVRTSVLSTYWRFKWALLPHLILDRPFFDTIQKMKEYEDGFFHNRYSSETLDVGLLEYSNIVNNILLRHDGPIHKFVLDIPIWFPKDADISHWIHIVSRKLVKEFTLSSEFYDGTRTLPSQLFSFVKFSHLTHFTLVHWSLPSVSTTFRGFPCLVSLKFSLRGCSTGEAHKLGILVSKCPLLESLDLKIHEEESCLTIHAPKLENLVVIGRLSRIILEETERIKMLSFNVVLDHKRDPMMEFFSCKPLVEKLILGFHFWRKFLGQPLGKLNLSNKLRELKSLILGGVRLHSQLAITYILCLFLMAPKLQFLDIVVFSVYEPDPSNSTVEEDFRLDHLKTAKISTSNYRAASQLIHMLLSSSPVLEEMTIATTIQDEEKLSIAKELSEYRRASANAQIIIKNRQGTLVISSSIS